MKIQNVKFFPVFIALFFAVFSLQSAASYTGVSLPEFTSKNREDWINSIPLKKSDLEGDVNLLYFWAFDCWNSYRSFPWLREIEKRFADRGFQVVGIHTPEFEHEKSRKNLRAKVREFKLAHPVMIDNSFKYWRKMNNRYWPAFYLTDREGNIVYKMIGETHKGQKRAEEFERVLEELVGK